MQVSVFHAYSLGIVSIAKVRGEDTIQVFPTEVTPFFEGDIAPDKAIVEDKGVDKDGILYTVQTETNTVITAQWLPISSTNRRTAPDVQKGEKVVIYQTADNDKYYWVSTGQNDGLRKLETVIYCFSNNTDPTKTELDLADCYWMMVSTHDKMVCFETSKADGEPFQHFIRLDTANGVFSYSDDIGNSLTVDSSINSIKGETADGGTAELISRKFIVDVDDIEFKFKKMNWKGGAIESTSDSFKDNGVKVGSKHTHNSTAPGTPTTTPNA